MKKKLFISLSTLLVLMSFLVRVYFVNSNWKAPNISYYEKGTTVEIGRNYFWNSGEDMDGYTVRVTDCWIQSLNDFLAENHVSEKDVRNVFDALILVKVEFQNENHQWTDESGIELGRYMLTGIDYSITINSQIFGMLNPNMPGMKFSLKPSSEPFEVILPFAVYESYVKLEHVKSDIPYLEVCAYPEMKLMKIN